ncbi:MAG TPA: EscU/YscU/HrcU family type III secretion system export apparatus switch protein [Anaerovoracaceae bacterium]|nr:EscU/YscU/HrcU family type III secretion system export apparatus switch protein [Anaerovoracaceae bacterium]
MQDNKDNRAGSGSKISGETFDGALKVAALKYDQNVNNAPKVVAAGSGHTARRILQVAMENGIAIYHDDSAATLLAKLDVGQEIPPELYQIVVDIYIGLLELADEKVSKRMAADSAPVTDLD